MNEQQHKISVIIPVYNTEKKLLETCIQSICDQSWKNLEIILVDDGSETESTKKVCSKFKVCDNRVMVIRQENKGASIARKTGIEAATGTYIMFVDSDDWIDSNMCSYLINLLIQNTCDIAEISVLNEPKDEPDYTTDCVIKLQGQNSLFEELVKDCINPLGWSIWGKMFKTETMKKTYKPHPDITRGEDVLSIAEYLLEANSMVSSSRKMYFYNKENINSTTSKNSIKDLTMCRFWKEMILIYQDINNEDAYQMVKAHYCGTLFGSILQCRYNQYPDYQKIEKKLRQELGGYRLELLFNKHVKNRCKCIIALICPQIFEMLHYIKRGRR